MTQSTSFGLGDIVIATDSSSISYRGHLHHQNDCGQFYFLPDGARQPFYAFPRQLEATGMRISGYVDTSLGNLGVGQLQRQAVYIAHRQKN